MTLFDPYVYRNMVLKNKFDTQDQDELDKIEASFVPIRLKELVRHPIDGNFDFRHLCAIHEYLFGDLFTWAGMPRTITIFKHEELLKFRSVEYAAPEDIEKEATIVIGQMHRTPWATLSLEKRAEEFSRLYSALWKIHPFREGNTRTITHFCIQFAEANDMPIDSELISENAEYLRGSLVAYNAIFEKDDLGDRSKPEYLEKIILDAFRRGELKHDLL